LDARVAVHDDQELGAIQGEGSRRYLGAGEFDPSCVTGGGAGDGDGDLALQQAAEAQDFDVWGEGGGRVRGSGRDGW